MATIKVNASGLAAGTTGSDRIYGDNRINIIAGGKGNDTIWGRGGADLLDGGAGTDKIYGESGNDIISGGANNDILTGGGGMDAFVFNTKLSRSNIDTITDFNVKYDMVWLDNAIFTKVGKANAYLSKAAFWIGEAAHDSNDRIIYNKATGVLSYDADGTGAKAAVEFAKLKPGLALTYKDFFVI